MPIAIVCPSCSMRASVPDAAAGKNVKCPKCSKLIRVSATTIATPAAPPVPEPLPIPVPPPPMDLEDDNRPLRKRRSKGDEPSDVEVDVTGVEVKLSFFALAFFFFACTPRVEIDGKVRKKAWGTHFFPVSPGKHTIKVYFR